MIVLSVLLLPAAAFADTAETEAVADGSQAEETTEETVTVDPGYLLRLSRRICELGYSSAPASSLTMEDIIALLSDDCYDQPVSPDSLFTEDTPFALLDWERNGYFVGAAAPEAIEADSETVSALLTVGNSYTLTDIKTGVQIRLRYLGTDGSGGVFSPISEWDAATLAGAFEQCFDYRFLSCAFTIGDVNYKAFCQVPPSFVTDDVPAGCLLFWEKEARTMDILSSADTN